MIGGINKISRLALLATMGVVAGGVASASAADLGGNCCADLEERIAELEATTARKGNRKVSLTVSGHVHESLLIWDDGRERNAYVVTNDVARTRFRFVGDAKINADWSAGYLLEIGVRSVRSSRTNQNTDDTVGGGNVLDVRHSAWWLQNKQLGKVWVGQTSEATDGITEINLANTVNQTTQFPDLDSGFFLRRKDTGALTARTYTDIFQGGTNQTPGEGDRFNVIKYETPTIAGFIGSASWGEDDIWSVALRYAGEFSGFKVAAGVGYEEATDNSGTNERGGSFSAANVGIREHVQSIGASGSIMHVATGLYVYGAYGQRDDRQRVAVLGAGADNKDSYWNVQGGIEKNWFGIGKTTLWGEYWNYNGGTVVSATTGGAQDCTSLGAARCLGSDVRVWGLGALQSIDAAAMDIYVLYRHTSTDVTLGTAGNVVAGKANLEDFQAVVMGALIKF